MRTLTRLRHDLVMIGLAAAEPRTSRRSKRGSDRCWRGSHRRQLINCVAEEKR